MGFKVPECARREKVVKKPFLILDINIGKGKTGRIALHEYDDPFEIANNFSRAFQLNKKQELAVLETLIEQKNKYLELQSQSNEHTLDIGEWNYQNL